MPRFEKGKPPGPGRPPGLRNKITLMLEKLANEGTEKVLCSVLDKAAKGDMYAAAIVLARTWPRRRGRSITLDLPPVADTASLVAAQAAVIAAMASGEITPEEAQSIAALLEAQRRTIETHDHALQIEELKVQMKERQAGRGPGFEWPPA